MKQSQARHIVPAQDFTKQRSTNQVLFGISTLHKNETVNGHSSGRTAAQKSITSPSGEGDVQKNSTPKSIDRLTSHRQHGVTKLSFSENDRKVTGGAQQKWTDDKEEEKPRKSSFNELSSRRNETSPEDVSKAEDKKTLPFHVNITSGKTVFEPSRLVISVVFRNRVSRKLKPSNVKPGDYDEEHRLATSRHVNKASAQISGPANPFEAIKTCLQASVQPKKPSSVQVLRMSKDPKRRLLCHDVKPT
ncbi:hypothetical protein B9Z55_010769 [Caenorhabditis nigoni]|uniref:Uncharacterized protein n=1 Tax=Caenorhabditis nigoni TaxID=1611254 RepID=A0A2G5UI77_9PELO|nr:hypothetical protein B9Z55_010769 [Caenorhabditis nigoni]